MKNTFNNIRQWKKESNIFRMYENINSNPKAGKYITIIHDGKTYRNPWVNEFYISLNKDFHSFSKDISLHLHLDIETGEILTEEKRFFNIPIVYIHTSICCFWQDISFTVSGLGKEKRYKIKGKGNKEITKDEIIRQVNEYINKNLLFPPGYYRDVQIINKLSKEQTILAVKNAVMNKNNDLFSDLFNWDRYFIKRYNIDINGNFYMKPQKAAKFCRQYVEKHGRPKQTKPIVKINIWDIMNNIEMNCDGDVDEIENEFYNEMETYRKDAIYI